MQCRARALVARQSSSAGGSLAPRLRAGGGGAGGSRLPPERPRRPRVSISRGPGPSRTSGRPPNAADRVGDHVCATSQARACVTRGAISGRQGQCSGSKLSWGALEMGCSAGGGSGSPGCAGRGASRKGGAKSSLGELRSSQRRSGFFAFSVWAVLHSVLCDFKA